MRRIFLGMAALCCVLIVAPRMSAQQSLGHTNDFVIENLCDPASLQEFDEQEQWLVSGLDFDQVERIRIELLERGFDPGFEPDRDNTIDPQLMGALAHSRQNIIFP